MHKCSRLLRIYGYNVQILMVLFVVTDFNCNFKIYCLNFWARRETLRPVCFFWNVLIIIFFLCWVENLEFGNSESVFVFEFFWSLKRSSPYRRRRRCRQQLVRKANREVLGVRHPPRGPDRPCYRWGPPWRHNLTPDNKKTYFLLLIKVLDNMIAYPFWSIRRQSYKNIVLKRLN